MNSRKKEEDWNIWNKGVAKEFFNNHYAKIMQVAFLPLADRKIRVFVEPGTSKDLKIGFEYSAAGGIF